MLSGNCSVKNNNEVKNEVKTSEEDITMTSNKVRVPNNEDTIIIAFSIIFCRIIFFNAYKSYKMSIIVTRNALFCLNGHD